MLATRSEPFSAPRWVFELKYDGFRLQAAKDGSRVTLRYRSGRNATSVFPEIAEAVARLPADRAILDGELVAFGPDGRSDFELLRARALSAGKRDSAATDVRACIFDLIGLDDADLRPLPLVERKGLLRDLLSGADHHLVFVDHVEERGEELLAGARQLRLEGVVAKRVDSSYLPGRSGAWRKFKVEETQDFVVIGIAAPSEGTFWRPGLVLARADGDGVRYVGRVAVGQPELASLEAVLPQLRRETSPCARAGRAKVWLDPAVVCEVRFLASSQRGLRHSVFVRFRPDKSWRDCTGRT